VDWPPGSGWPRGLSSATAAAAHLEGAVLQRAHLDRADLSGAHLESAELAHVHLERALLRDGHLEGLTLPWLKPGDARDRRGMAFEVERTPALPDLLYAMGLPGPNRSVRDGRSVRRAILKRPPHTVPSS
jgi:uncharacterized protein YjbI with pentapeptide repeats